MGDTIVYILCGILTEREKQLIQTPEGQRVVLEARRVFLDMDKEI
ncbi:Na-translocating system protein MpsC family protein [Neobacillus pocheonensis]